MSKKALLFPIITLLSFFVFSITAYATPDRPALIVIVPFAPGDLTLSVRDENGGVLTVYDDSGIDYGIHKINRGFETHFRLFEYGDNTIIVSSRKYNFEFPYPQDVSYIMLNLRNETYDFVNIAVRRVMYTFVIILTLVIGIIIFRLIYKSHKKCYIKINETPQLAGRDGYNDY